MWVQELPVPLVLPVACDGPSTAAALLRELFPDLPLDMDSLVATLGPEEATRVCFEIMGGCDPDGGPAADGGDGDSFGSRWGLENDMDITEQLGVLQSYFPDAPLEALFDRLNVAGSLDGAIAACMQEESAAQASAEQQAAQAASAPPSGKEKEKVSALRHAYPVRRSGGLHPLFQCTDHVLRRGWKRSCCCRCCARRMARTVARLQNWCKWGSTAALSQPRAL
jgi:hypothetical protein